MENYYTTSNFETGVCPPGYAGQRNVTEKDLVELWFVAPLERMSGDDAFACLTLCFPIIEAVIRYELLIPDEQQVSFSDNSPALAWFAKFMSIPEAQARQTWDGLRNGLLHRAMIKEDIDYELTGERLGRVAAFKDGKIVIYVWEMRAAVVALIRKHGKKLWKGTSSPLPRVFIRI